MWGLGFRVYGHVVWGSVRGRITWEMKWEPAPSCKLYFQPVVSESC